LTTSREQSVPPWASWPVRWRARSGWSCRWRASAEVTRWVSSWPEFADESGTPDSRLVVLTGLDTKGLEFDGIVVVAPQEIQDESPTGRADPLRRLHPRHAADGHPHPLVRRPGHSGRPEGADRGVVVAGWTNADPSLGRGDARRVAGCARPSPTSGSWSRPATSTGSQSSSPPISCTTGADTVLLHLARPQPCLEGDRGRPARRARADR
jgi:hypothetical protein